MKVLIFRVSLKTPIHASEFFGRIWPSKLAALSTTDPRRYILPGETRDITYLAMVRFFPIQNCPFAWGSGPSSKPNTRFLGQTRLHDSNCKRPSVNVTP